MDVRFIHAEQHNLHEVGRGGFAGDVLSAGDFWVPREAPGQDAAQLGAAAAGLRLPLLSAARGSPLCSAANSEARDLLTLPGVTDFSWIWHFVGHALSLRRVRARLKLHQEINKAGPKSQW